MIDVVIVGCGIMGSTIGKTLQSQGREVLILDDKRKMAGTPASGGHLKPSWFGMAKEDYIPAMALLDSIWGLHEHEFLVHPKLAKTIVHRVDTDEVVKTKYNRATVLSISDLDDNPRVLYRPYVKGVDTTSIDPIEVTTKLLVITAGHWSNMFYPVNIIPKQGVSFRLPTTISQPFIKPWAPYKQVVCHQQNPDEVWAGDGSALLSNNWTEQRTEDCLLRCKEAIGIQSIHPIRSIMGIRPYCKTKQGIPCLLEKIGNVTWLATGAAKLGTIAAGFSAIRIRDNKPL